jgi:peptidoglycan hydrolase-like protein with peptidoglycan-binding domain
MEAPNNGNFRTRRLERQASLWSYVFYVDKRERMIRQPFGDWGSIPGQADGILGPDTRRAIEDYQVKNKLPVTGQPDQGLNALLGIF